MSSTNTQSPYGTTNPTRGPNDVDHHTGSAGVQPVHNSSIANKLDPRVDADRTNAQGSAHEYNNSSAPAITGASGINSSRDHASGVHSSHAANQLDPRIEAGHNAHHSSTGRDAHDLHSSSGLTSQGAPVHGSHTANQLDPRTESTGVRGVGVSPAGTESHNSTTSNYDGRPAGSSDRHDHHLGTTGGALNHPSDRSVGHDHSHSQHISNTNTNDLSSDLSSTHISSTDRSIGHDQHQHHSHSSVAGGPVTGPDLTSTRIDGGAHVHSHTAGVASNPLGPEIAGSHHSHGQVHTTEYVSGTQHGSSTTGTGAFGVNPTHSNAHTGQAGVQPVHNSQALNQIDPRVDSDQTRGTSSHGTPSHGISSNQTPNSLTGKNHESTIGGGGGIGRGDTHDGTGAGVDARDKNGAAIGTGLTGDHHHNSTTAASSGLATGAAGHSTSHTSTTPHSASHTGHSTTDAAHKATDATHTADGHKPTIIEKVKGALTGHHQ